MKNIIAVLLLLVSSVASAAYLDPASLESNLNSGFGWRPSLGTQVAFKSMRVAQCKWSFAKQGGSTAAAISLRDLDNKACVLPKDAIIMSAIIDVISVPTTGSTSTIAVGTGQAANDIKTAAANALYSGRVAGIPVHTAASAIKLTADRTPTITVGSGNLTGGEMNVLFEYIMSK